MFLIDLLRNGGGDREHHKDQIHYLTTLRGMIGMLRNPEGTESVFDIEDGLKDILYTESGKRPLWVQEPTGKWRIFKYYSGEEISNFAHAFYTRLGVNVFMYALTN